MLPSKNYHEFFMQITIICCLISISGCASRIPTGKYELLKDSSESLYLNTIETYSRIEELQRRFAITTAPDSKINRDTFKPQVDGESYDLTPELRFREVALEVLVKYVDVLHAFSAKDYLIQVDKATQQLGASLKNLIETSDKLSSSDGSKAAGIFSALINKLSQEVVKQKKEKALKQVMDRAQSDIEQLSELIVSSNTKVKTAIGIMLDRIIAHANYMRPEYGTIERLHFDMDVAEIIIDAEKIELALESMNKAMLEIPEAHKEIRLDFDRIQPKLESLQLLIKEVQSVKKFFRELNN